MELTPGAALFGRANPAFRGGRALGLRRLQTTVLVKPLCPERRAVETPPYFLRRMDHIAHTSAPLPSGPNSPSATSNNCGVPRDSKITGHR